MSHFETNLEIEARAVGLVARLDESSIQISRDTDPRFWVRVELETDPLRVSDFSLGSSDHMAGALGLRYAIALAGASDLKSLEFTDIAPSGLEIEKRVDLLRSAINTHARKTQRVVEKFEPGLIRGKLGLSVEFT